MFNDPKPNDISNWVCVMERSTELEIASAQNYLSNLDIPSNILTKRDSAFNLNVGDLALVYLYVPKEYEEEARQALEEMDLPDDSGDED
ncbi:MAG TPA: hypothetical protein VFG39_04700 [Balneolaceae bacterium]|nr:hypothetical protein [Balneolaceae bacterium]